ncbi:MAG: radical SAM protein, partial [Salinibacterium sp.]|nr:radical SAM protein [Salinibacterium sp.]
MGLHDALIQEAFKDRNPGDFPFSLGVEVTNHCNLRCPMCPREVADRGYGNMDYELFTKIASETSGRERTVFLPTGFGESFIHPRFHDMLNYLRDHDVKITCLITNATYLNDRNVHALIDSQIPFVNISLDGTVKEVYEKIRVKANYESVVENVERLFRLREERGSRFPYIILRMIKMDETADDVETFKARWEPFLHDCDEIAFSNYQTWSNTVEDRRVELHDGLKQV